MKILAAVVSLLAVSVQGKIFFNDNDGRLYYAGGAFVTFDESVKFCEEIGHEMLGWLTDTERYMLQLGLLRDTRDEHWINVTVTRGYIFGSDGQMISSFLTRESACQKGVCSATVMSNGAVGVRARDVDFIARSICAIQTGEKDVLNKLAKLWDILNDEEKTSLTTKLPGLMIRVNARRVRQLEDQIARDAGRISIIEKILNIMN